MLLAYGEELLAFPPIPQAVRQPLVSCPLLLIQYIRSCCAYLEVVSSIRNLRTPPYCGDTDPHKTAKKLPENVFKIGGSHPSEGGGSNKLQTVECF